MDTGREKIVPRIIVFLWGKFRNSTEVVQAAGTCFVDSWTEKNPAAGFYSLLSAVIGEMEAARIAGIMAAKNAAMASDPAATISATGSQLETP